MPKVAATSDRLYGPLARGFGERIRAAVQRFESKSEAAAAMSLSTDQVNTLINEKSVPNFAAMASLAKQLGLSLDWLAFDGPANVDLSTRKSFSTADDTVALKRIDIGPPLPFSRMWLQESFNRSSEQLGLMSAPGTAMEPSIKRHALLIVDLSSTRPVDGEIFLFDFGGDFVVRRTQREPDGSLVLKADNASYDPLRIPRDAKSVMGRVIWIGNTA